MKLAHSHNSFLCFLNRYSIYRLNDIFNLLPTRWKMQSKVKNEEIVLTDKTELSNPNREEKIAEIAYYKSESRGFEPGHDLDDWYQAELEYSI